MTWSAIGTLSIAFGGDVNAGLAVTSHNATTEATAVFDDTCGNLIQIAQRI